LMGGAVAEEDERLTGTPFLVRAVPPARRAVLRWDDECRLAAQVSRGVLRWDEGGQETVL